MLSVTLYCNPFYHGVYFLNPQKVCVGDLFSNAMSQEQGNIENVNR